MFLLHIEWYTKKDQTFEHKKAWVSINKMVKLNYLQLTGINYNKIKEYILYNFIYEVYNICKYITLEKPCFLL